MASTPVRRSVMVDIVTSAGSTVSGCIHCCECGCGCGLVVSVGVGVSVLIVSECWL